MQQTPNLGLRKPEGSDVVDIDDLNYNSDVLDVEVTKLATPSQDGRMSAADKAKLDGIAAGAEVNQNAFTNVKVGATTIAADSKSDTLELVAGSGISLTPDATNDKVTIGVAFDDTVHGNRGGGNLHATATQTTAGFMSAADKSKLDSTTSAATPNTIVQRDPNGRFKAGAPAASDDVARKDTVDNAIAALRGAAPGTLDTLAKLAQAINNDPNFAATINAALAGKLDKTGGTVTGPVALLGAQPTLWFWDSDDRTKDFRIINDGGKLWIQQFNGSTWIRDLLVIDMSDGNVKVDGTLTLNGLNIRSNSGILEINDGTGWKPVGFDPTSMTVNPITAYSDAIYINGSSYVDVVSLSGSGVLGQLDVFMGGSQVGYAGVSLVVDGVEKKFYTVNANYARSPVYVGNGNPSTGSGNGTAGMFSLSTPIKFNTSLIVRINNTSSSPSNIGWSIKGVYYT